MKKSVLFILIFSLFFVLSGCGEKTTFQEFEDKVSKSKAKEIAREFINNNMVKQGVQATVSDIFEKDGLYELTLNINGQNYTSYISLNGKRFFREGYPIEEIKNSTPPAKAKQKAEIPKNKKPKVELFVMSHCPYGTQIEKGILPVWELLDKKIDFKLKFCDYAMHKKKELDEQLTQFCIQKQQPSKFKSYLKCFLKEGKSEACLSEVNVNREKLDDCITVNDQKYKVTEMYNDKSTWLNGSFPVFNVFKDDVKKYGVKGSPTIVINGVEASSGRDAQSLLITVCSAFENPPQECQEKLDSVPPAPGFGFEGSGGNTGGCGG
jgi:glutaredoxin